MVAAVPGSKTVEVVMVTQDFSTRGTMASSPAKHGHGPDWASASGTPLLNKNTLALLMVMTR